MNVPNRSAPKIMYILCEQIISYYYGRYKKKQQNINSVPDVTRETSNPVVEGRIFCVIDQQFFFTYVSNFDPKNVVELKCTTCKFSGKLAMFLA